MEDMGQNPFFLKVLPSPRDEGALRWALGTEQWVTLGHGSLIRLENRAHRVC
jgi:hypothetical protein